MRDGPWNDADDSHWCFRLSLIRSARAKAGTQHIPSLMEKKKNSPNEDPFPGSSSRWSPCFDPCGGRWHRQKELTYDWLETSNTPFPSLPFHRRSREANMCSILWNQCGRGHQLVEGLAYVCTMDVSFFHHVWFLAASTSGRFYLVQLLVLVLVSRYFYPAGNRPSSGSRYSPRIWTYVLCAVGNRVIGFTLLHKRRKEDNKVIEDREEGVAQFHKHTASGTQSSLSTICKLHQKPLMCVNAYIHTTI